MPSRPTGAATRSCTSSPAAARRSPSPTSRSTRPRARSCSSRTPPRSARRWPPRPTPRCSSSAAIRGRSPPPARSTWRASGRRSLDDDPDRARALADAGLRELPDSPACATRWRSRPPRAGDDDEARRRLDGAVERVPELAGEARTDAVLARCSTRPAKRSAGGGGVARALLAGAQQAVAQVGLLLGRGIPLHDARQRLERVQPEELEEEVGRAVQDGAELRAPRLLDEAALLERRRRRLGGDAADARDLRARDRLQVGDDRQRLGLRRASAAACAAWPAGAARPPRRPDRSPARCRRRRA